VDIAVNLTVQRAHAAVTTACLEAGKHVWSEKPLATTYADARALVELAGRQGLRLGCSPFTVFGEAQQTAWKWLRDGRLGPLRLVYADVNWGRIESWHPEPHSFYEVGPLFDVGVYPLMILTTLLGPARRVSAYGTVLHPQRRTKADTAFNVAAPDFVVAFLEFDGGCVARLTANFYVHQRPRQNGIEFHGDAASLFLESWLIPEANVEFGEFGKPYERVPLVREPGRGVRWGRGVMELVEALGAGRPHRIAGDQAAHVVEILCSTTAAIESRDPAPIRSDFVRPEPFEWAG
jgi:predicted dehydrogenase